MNSSIEQQEFAFDIFRGKMNIIVYTPEREETIKIINGAYAEALRLQKIFNFFDEKSELSKLNKKRKMKVSKELKEVIENAIKFSEMTNGKYDISLGKEFLQRKKGEEVEKVGCDYNDILIKGDEVILNHKDILIDLGSIAKGYITDRIGEYLKEKGIEDFMIDSRGDILFAGELKHRIGVEHPRKEGRICSIEVGEGGVATSGDYNQFDKSFDKSHIINPNEIISLTVIAPSLEEADVYATSLFVANDEERAKMLKNKEIKVMMIDKNLNLRMFNGFKEIIC